MGYILMILCILFCIGVLIFMLSTDAKNIVVNADEATEIAKAESLPADTKDDTSTVNQKDN